MKERTEQEAHEQEELSKESSAGGDRQLPKAVYSIIESEGQDRSFWLRLGTAYVNRDQSLTVHLNALPVNKRLHIRELPKRDYA